MVFTLQTFQWHFFKLQVHENYYDQWNIYWFTTFTNNNPCSSTGKLERIAYLLSEVLLHWNMYLTKNGLLPSDPLASGQTDFSPLWLFYHFKFFMMKRCGGNLAKAEQGLAFTAAIWNSSPRWLVPAPSVGFCLSISAICARLCRLWAPALRQNDWHFLSNNQGMVPRAVSWHSCALFLTNPGKERQDGEQKTSAHVVQLCLSYFHRKRHFWWPCC